jgi:hypothetical protein
VQAWIFCRAFLQGDGTVQASLPAVLLTPVQPGHFPIQLAMQRVFFLLLLRRSSFPAHVTLKRIRLNELFYHNPEPEILLNIVKISHFYDERIFYPDMFRMIHDTGSEFKRWKDSPTSVFMTNDTGYYAKNNLKLFPSPGSPGG